LYITSRSFGKHCPEALEIVKQVCKVEFNPFGRALRKEELKGIIKSADALLVGADKIDGELIRSALNLKLIARHGVGLDNIDLEAAKEKGVVVTFAPQANSDSVADFTMALILSLARNVPFAHISMKEGKWEAKKFVGRELAGKTLGIIRLGSIGYRVAERASGFKLKILVCDPYIDESRAQQASVEMVDLQRLLRESDVVTIHAILTPQTQDLIGEEELKQMKQTAFLINTARAEIVEEEALCKALKEKWIAGAAIDVFMREPPPPNSPLLNLDNVIVTPHLASYAKEALIRMDLMNAKDIERFFKGKQPKNAVR
jgi:D-3-phosphoglycerate dehydrogenase